MIIEVKKLSVKDRENLISKLKIYVVKGEVKMDGEVIRISDNAEITMGDYFKVCNLLKDYGVELKD